jgi:hypothetical protein
VSSRRGRPASKGVMRLTVATGLVSVIPQPWTTSIPRDRNSSIIEVVGAVPPVVISSPPSLASPRPRRLAIARAYSR